MYFTIFYMFKGTDIREGTQVDYNLFTMFDHIFCLVRNAIPSESSFLHLLGHRFNPFTDVHLIEIIEYNYIQQK